MRVGRTDPELVVTDHENRIGALERNGSDPTQWVVVGSGAGAPAFQNGFTNVGGARVPMRYRFLRPLDPLLDPNTVNPRGIEIQGAVHGGALGQTIFTLLQPRYHPDGTPFTPWPVATRDYDLHLAASDSIGAFVVLTVLAGGDVVYGFV